MKLVKKILKAFRLKRFIVYAAGIPLMAGFLKQAFEGKLTHEMFITFPLGIVILYSPQLAIHLLTIWKGKEDKD
jgi:hypothetical protein